MQTRALAPVASAAAREREQRAMPPKRGLKAFREWLLEEAAKAPSPPIMAAPAPHLAQTA